MEIVRATTAPAYEAPRHFGMSTHRLQGAGASSAVAFTIGLSQALPAGGAELSASPLERVYLVLEGTDRSKTAIVISGHYDSMCSDIMDSSCDAPGADDDASAPEPVRPSTPPGMPPGSAPPSTVGRARRRRRRATGDPD